jgi:hypothetical protein
MELTQAQIEALGPEQYAFFLAEGDDAVIPPPELLEEEDDEEYKRWLLENQSFDV